MKKLFTLKIINRFLICNEGIFGVAKLISFFFFITIFNAFGSKSDLQNTTLNIGKSDISNHASLNITEGQEKLLSLHNSKLIYGAQEVNINTENKTIYEIPYNLLSQFDTKNSTENSNLLTVNEEKVTDRDFQQRQIRGRVAGPNTDPLPGVSVVVKGSTIGTLTDVNGDFSLSIPQDAKALTFSFVGMISQEIEIGNQSVFNIIMEEAAIGLDEVVVIGYGTMKRSDLTGSVASVSTEMLESRPVSTFEDAMKGRTSGVQIRQTGGDLQGDFSIAIRGIGSVTGSNSPLIVVDGVPLFSSNFSMINPKSIASIDILKDASATAIYGARAANGVIIISTKTGQKGKTQLIFDADFGFEEITKKYDLLSTEQQRQLFVEAFKNSNRSTAVYDDPTNPVWQIDTDWQDLATRTAFRQSYNLGFSGGSEGTNYSGAASYLDREGTIKNTDYKLWSLRFNFNSAIKEWLKLSTNIQSSYQKELYISGLDSWQGGFRSLSEVHSYTKPYDENGNLTAVNTTAAPYFGSNGNPLIDILLPTRKNDAARILGNAKLDISLAKGLVLSGNLGADILAGNGYSYLPVYSIGAYNRPEGSVSENSNKQINWVSDLTLTYEKIIGNHNIKLLTGLSAQQFILKNNNATGTGTIDNHLNQLSNQTNFNASGSDVTAGLVSSFMRLNYNYGNRYLTTITVRRDGSSKFGPENRYGLFPSGSLAWRISEESFLQSQNLIDDLKLRVSYGLTGNQNIGDFAFITKAGNAPYVFGNSLQVGNAPLNMGNPKLKWEATVQFDVGLDVTLFKGRINSSVDYYNKHSQDLLISQPVPLTSGVTTDPIVNVGSVQNRGVEFSLKTVNLTGQFSWSTDFNISFNKNKVIDIGSNSLGEPLEIPGENINLSNMPINLTKAGHPVGAFYTYEYIGVWQLGEEEAAKKWSNAVPGDPRYADLNPNGIFDAGDKTWVGNPHPKYFGGIDNTFSYNRFSFSILAEFAGGYKVFNSARNLMARGVPFLQQFAEVADFWTPTNPSNTVPRPSQGGNTTTLVTIASSRWLEDADYIRIKNMKLSYDIPSRLLGEKMLQSARLSLIGSNLITFTGYSGLDPEVSSRNSLLSAGIDHTPYPQVRHISMEIQVIF